MEDILRSSALDFGADWDKHLPLSMAPYEALYGRLCATPHYWAETLDRIELGPELIEEMKNKIKKI